MLASLRFISKKVKNMLQKNVFARFFFLHWCNLRIRCFWILNNCKDSNLWFDIWLSTKTKNKVSGVKDHYTNCSDYWSNGARARAHTHCANREMIYTRQGTAQTQYWQIDDKQITRIVAINSWQQPPATLVPSCLNLNSWIYILHIFRQSVSPFWSFQRSLA